MTSLSPGTNYDFYVQEVCGANDVSSWSGPYTFTTNALTIAGSCGIFQIALLDSYGDGWNGGSLSIQGSTYCATFLYPGCYTNSDGNDYCYSKTESLAIKG